MRYAARQGPFDSFAVSMALDVTLSVCPIRARAEGEECFSLF